VTEKKRVSACVYMLVRVYRQNPYIGLFCGHRKLFCRCTDLLRIHKALVWIDKALVWIPTEASRQLSICPHRALLRTHRALLRTHRALLSACVYMLVRVYRQNPDVDSSLQEELNSFRHIILQLVLHCRCACVRNSKESPQK